MLFSKMDLKKLQEASPFDTVEEMDEHIDEYIEVLKNEVPNSVIDVLYALGRSSLRVVGISFKKQTTIAELTVSRKTVNKSVKILREIGIIDTVQTSTKAGRPSVLVYRILPFCMERLQVGVTSDNMDEANNNGELNVTNEFEPIKAETSKKHEGKEETPISRENRLEHYLAIGLEPQAILRYENMKWDSEFFTSQVWKVEETGEQSAAITLRVQHHLYRIVETSEEELKKADRMNKIRQKQKQKMEKHM